jgi:hypothetical protein
VYPTSGIDELDEVVGVVPSAMDGSIISYAASALTMNGKEVLYYSVGTSSSSSWSSIFMMLL